MSVDIFAFLLARRSLASALNERSTATRLSRPRCASARITPPFPSPPILAPSSRILSATLTSPTAVSVHLHPNLEQMSSLTREVLQLRTKSFYGEDSYTYWLQMASVSSSRIGTPNSLMRTQRSASGSTAKPMSKCLPFKKDSKSRKFAGVGSGCSGSYPTSVLNLMMCVPVFFSKMSRYSAPEAFWALKATVILALLIASRSTKSDLAI